MCPSPPWSKTWRSVSWKPSRTRPVRLESPEKEIEISFEGDLNEDVDALKESLDSGSPVEELEEAEPVRRGSLRRDPGQPEG